MNDFDLLGDLFEVPSALDFSVVLDFSGAVPSSALFLPVEPDRVLTRGEKEWVQEAKRNPEIATTPPSAPALRSLQRSMEKYAGPMPATREQWQNYVMQRYYELTLDPDPKISKPALDSLAKTGLVGLHDEKTEITVELKSTIDLQAEALTLLRSIATREEKVIN